MLTHRLLANTHVLDAQATRLYIYMRALPNSTWPTGHEKLAGRANPLCTLHTYKANLLPKLVRATCIIIVYGSGPNIDVASPACNRHRPAAYIYIRVPCPTQHGPPVMRSWRGGQTPFIHCIYTNTSDVHHQCTRLVPNIDVASLGC